MIYLVSGQHKLFDSELYTCISVEESLHLLNKCSVLQYDSETTGIESRIDKLVCIQFGNDKYDFQIVIDCDTIDVLKYKDILESKFLVGQNLKFDIKFLYNYGIIPRKVYDTMIVEQLLYLGYPTGVISYSLASIAKRYLNIDIDKTIRGQIIWRGLDDETILYSANDVKYLEQIMQKQLERCKETNCTTGAKLECDFVPVISYLEWCGIKLDESKWKEKMFNDAINLVKYKKELEEYVYTIQPKYFHKNMQGDLFEGFNTEPICDINWDSSIQVIKLCKDLGFNTSTQDKKTGEDKDSVLEKHLKMQKGINDKFLSLYFKYKEFSKVCSTYGQGHLNAVNPFTGRIHTEYRQLGAASGRMSCGSNKPNESLGRAKKLPAKQCILPNIQQLPHDKITRSCFVAEKGNYFCSSDFSALESRLGADIYKEQSMIDEFLYKSGDIHSLVAKACFPELKDLTTEEIKSNHSELRTKAKPIGFSQQFGGSAMAIAQSLGCSLEEAENIANAYNNGFPGIASFKQKGSKFVRENGYVLMNPDTGHRMYWWDHKEWLERQKSFTKEFWEKYKINHKGTGDDVALMVKHHFQAASKWDRMALNAPTQSTGSIILKDSMISFFNYIVNNKLFNIVKIVALVHDKIALSWVNCVNCWKLLKK